MAKVIEFIWKIWLRLNFLTQDVDNVYTGEVTVVCVDMMLRIRLRL